MKSLVKPDFDTLKHIYEVDRLTVRQIAAKYGVTKTAAQMWFHRYGIPLREAHNGMVNRGLREPTREELVQLIHVEHLGYREVASMFGVTTIAISRRLKQFNIPRPTHWDTRYKGNRPVLPTQEELTALYESGISLQDIGEQFNVSEIVIRKLCKEYAITVKRNGWNGGKRFECKDGHQVRSTYEQRIDDWLFEHSIPHVYEPALPCDKRYHADFSANGWYIEIWGVTDNARYTERRKHKTQLYHQHGLPLIELGKDFFSSRGQVRLKRRLAKLLIPAPIPLLSQ